MTATFTIPVNTHIYGLGAERRAPSRYLTLRERAISAADLIAEYVREELQQHKDQFTSSLAMHYILAEDPRIEPSAVAGPREYDEEIARAHAALAGRQYLLFVDGCPINSLHDTVMLTDQSQVVFVRLLPLVGG